LVGNASSVGNVKENIARAEAICAAHAAQGCAIDSNATLGGGPMLQRRQDGMNDVAFSNWRGDYANFITQLPVGSEMTGTTAGTVMADQQPFLQTRGWWRVAMAGNASLFGRFARGWKDPGNANSTMALKIDVGMWGGLPLSANATHDLTMRLVFLDLGTGQFSIHYDSSVADENAGEPIVVKKTDSGEWRELCASLISPRFGGSGPSGSDVWITNDDEEDDIFDSLEISKESAAEIAMAGCNWR
jgi:hypothetical protein